MQRKNFSIWGLHTSKDTTVRVRRCWLQASMHRGVGGTASIACHGVPTRFRTSLAQRCLSASDICAKVAGTIRGYGARLGCFATAIVAVPPLWLLAEHTACLALGPCGAKACRRVGLMPVGVFSRAAARNGQRRAGTPAPGSRPQCRHFQPRRSAMLPLVRAWTAVPQVLRLGSVLGVWCLALRRRASSCPPASRILAPALRHQCAGSAARTPTPVPPAARRGAGAGRPGHSHHTHLERPFVLKRNYFLFFSLERRDRDVTKGRHRC